MIKLNAHNYNLHFLQRGITSVVANLELLGCSSNKFDFLGCRSKWNTLHPNWTFLSNYVTTNFGHCSFYSQLEGFMNFHCLSFEGRGIRNKSYDNLFRATYAKILRCHPSITSSPRTRGYLSYLETLQWWQLSNVGNVMLLILLFSISLTQL